MGQKTKNNYYEIIYLFFCSFRDLEFNVQIKNIKKNAVGGPGNILAKNPRHEKNRTFCNLRAHLHEN